MATIRGEVVLFGEESLAHPVGAPVVIRQGETGLASTEVGPNHRFEAEIGDDVSGGIEVMLVLEGAAPTMVEAGSGDLDITVIYNPVGKTYL